MMNWGNRLLIVFFCFAALIGTLVYKCMHQDFQLVSADYYNEELRYQDKINGMRNALTAGNIELRQTDSFINIQMPKALKDTRLSGQVYFYCPANASSDLKLALHTNDGIMMVGKSKLLTSKYTVKLSIQSANKSYYYEQNISVTR